MALGGPRRQFAARNEGRVRIRKQVRRVNRAGLGRPGFSPPTLRKRHQDQVRPPLDSVFAILLTVIETPAAARILDGAALARILREEARLEAARLSGAGVRLICGSSFSGPIRRRKRTSPRRPGPPGRPAARRRPCGSRPGRHPPRCLPRWIAAIATNRWTGSVQLPLEPGHDPRRVFDAIDPEKDVDGVHPENVGRLHQGRPRFTPCTPAGILALLDSAGIEIPGRRAVVLGRSDIVGKPVAALLTMRDATVTICHSKTRGPGGHLLRGGHPDRGDRASRFRGARARAARRRRRRRRNEPPDARVAGAGEASRRRASAARARGEGARPRRRRRFRRRGPRRRMDLARSRRRRPAHGRHAPEEHDPRRGCGATAGKATRSTR